MNKKNKILYRLKSTRESALLSQDFVANKLGINRTTYTKKELGFIPISTDEWLLLSEILDKDLSYFFNSEQSTKYLNKYNSNTKEAVEDEKHLLTLYRSLERDEKNDLIASIKLLLKRVNRKKVRQSLKELTDAIE